jgi:hypothetical protein
VDVYVHVFFTFALDGGDSSSSVPGIRDHGSHWVTPGVGLEVVKRRKLSAFQEWNLDSSVVQPVV